MHKSSTSGEGGSEESNEGGLHEHGKSRESGDSGGGKERVGGVRECWSVECSEEKRGKRE
jgi:hypothetical protein